MNRTIGSRLRSFSCLFVALTVSSVEATNCNRIDDPDARMCCERNLPQESMRQSVSLTVADDRGTVSNIAAELAWKRFEDGSAKARVSLTAPPRQAGTVVLLTARESELGEELAEPSVVLFKPSERRDRLITISALSGEMFGTDLSYEDFTHFYGTDPAVNVERTGEEEWEGHDVVVVRSAPSDPDLAYDRGSVYSHIETRFDIQRCVPLSTRFFEDDDLLKELIVDAAEVRQYGQRWVPHKLVMHDYFEDSRTILFINEIEFDPELPDRLFDRSSLKRGR